MILGVGWLQTLDELTLNFSDHSVKFSKEGVTPRSGIRVPEYVLRYVS